MKSAQLIGVIMTFLVFLSGNCHSQPQKPVAIKFGTIPVLQSLPIFVAAEKGFFKENNVNVEIVTFNSAMEKDVALTTGRINGYFGDMMTPMVLQANGVGIKMVATNYNTTADQRMFAILASPRSKTKNIAQAAKDGIAAGSNVIAEYLTVRLAGQKGISQDRIKLIDIKSIPIRFQMLLSGQVPAALLPEPLASLAEIKGAKSLIDDRGQHLSPTVLVFHDKILQEHPGAVKSFLDAIRKASAYINKNPNEVRAIMNKECKVPEPLQLSFPIPVFPALSAPDKKQLTDVYQWLRGKSIIKKELTFKDMVADGFVP